MKGLLRRVWRWIEEQPTHPVSPRAGDETGTPAAVPTADEVAEPISPERRRLLVRLGIALSGLGAVLVGTPVVGVLLSPLLRRDPPVWRALGRVDDFRIGETVKVSFLDPEPLPWAGFASRSAAWLRRESEQEFAAFSIYCTHTGCPVGWHEGASLFICPCHGGVFYRDGAVAAGPPPKPLERLAVRVRDGQVEIQASPAPLPGESTGANAAAGPPRG